jgi:hypothetical protein
MAAGVADGKTSVKNWTVQVICRNCKSIKDVFTGKYQLLYPLQISVLMSVVWG